MPVPETIEETFARLTPVFRDVLDDDELIVQSKLTAADVDTWDSLSHIQLVVSIEQTFNIRFSAAEVSALKNVGDLANLIIEKQSGE